jgi:hypothetical protein
MPEGLSADSQALIRTAGSLELTYPTLARFPSFDYQGLIKIMADGNIDFLCKSPCVELNFQIGSPSYSSISVQFSRQGQTPNALD